MASTTAGAFPFGRLPEDLRLLVWEATLPDQRVFHVDRIASTRFLDKKRSPRGLKPSDSPRFFTFHITHAPPSALHVCSESRAVSLCRGFFLSPYPELGIAGVWFCPERDVLYFDRTMRLPLRMAGSEGGQQRKVHAPILGWDRVLHAGLEWRAFFRDVPRPDPGEEEEGEDEEDDMGKYWRAAVAPLRASMPRLRTLGYVMPKTRHRGGIQVGREPWGASAFEAALVPLPEGTQIPWETLRNVGAGQDEEEEDPMAVLAGRVMGLRRWSAVRMDLEMALWREPVGEEGQGEEEDEEDARSEVAWDEWMSRRRKTIDEPPRVEGWWLVREGAPKKFSDPQIREFAS